MIADEVLLRLTPDPTTIPYVFELYGAALEGRARTEAAWRTSIWAAALRDELGQRVQVDERLSGLVDTSGFVGIGVFRALDSGAWETPAFPVVEGYRFGAVLFRAVRASNDSVVDAVSLDGFGQSPDGADAPVVQFVARTELHSHAPDGRIAAYFEEDGALNGITARHVVEPARPGDRVGVHCPHGKRTRVLRSAPGLIDAAAVTLTCQETTPTARTVRAPLHGEQVHLHLDDAGPTDATIMLAVDTSAQLRTAAVPQHFLTSDHGLPGHSGSRVSSDSDDEFLGVYLGKTQAEDTHGVSAWYGYALDLEQAAGVLGVTAPLGEI